MMLGASCAGPPRDWNTEVIPDEQGVRPIQTNLGTWSCHTLGIQHAEDAWEQVTLWCSTEGHEDQAWLVTTLCQGDDVQESITLTDREIGKFYELTVLCSIS